MDTFSLIRIGLVAAGVLLVGVSVYRNWRANRATDGTATVVDASAVNQAILLLRPHLTDETAKTMAVEVALSLWAVKPVPAPTTPTIDVAELARRVAEIVNPQPSPAG